MISPWSEKLGGTARSLVAQSSAEAGASCNWDSSRIPFQTHALYLIPLHCLRSVAGLFAAAVCADHFDTVTIIEQDAWTNEDGTNLPTEKAFRETADGCQSRVAGRSRVMQYLALHSTFLHEALRRGLCSLHRVCWVPFFSQRSPHPFSWRLRTCFRLCRVKWNSSDTSEPLASSNDRTYCYWTR